MKYMEQVKRTIKRTKTIKAENAPEVQLSKLLL